jgi:hypothetical protein
MALAVKADEALDPEAVDPLGPDAVVFCTDQGADTGEKPGRLCGVCKNGVNRHRRVNRHDQFTAVLAVRRGRMWLMRLARFIRLRAHGAPLEGVGVHEAYEPAGSPDEPGVGRTVIGEQDMSDQPPVLTGIGRDNKHFAVLTGMSGCLLITS